METPYNFFEKKIYNTLYRIKNKVEKFQHKKRLDYQGTDIQIYVDTPREFYFRAHSCQKEPGTVRWIESMKGEDEVLYDIGANIGAYSLVAATLGIKVIAIEPAFQNFFQLNRNISLNHFDHLISAFPVALSTHEKINKFNYIETTTGTSKCFYNEKNSYHLKVPVSIQKDTLIYSLDNFIKQFQMPTPSALKIDVDGGERDVLGGAQETLRNPKLKSIMIEIDESEKSAEDLLKNILGHGFKLIQKFPFEKQVTNYQLRR